MDTSSSPEKKSIIETTAASFGRDVEEAKSLGHVDKADLEVDAMFKKGKRTEDSPAFKAVWDAEFPIDLFDVGSLNGHGDSAVEKVFENSLNVLKTRAAAGTMYDDKGKIRNEVLEELAKAGYWGVLIDKKYGGSGASFRAFARFITEVAKVEATVAGLASVHGCIGAVDPITAFGNDDQQRRYLPRLASGERLSAFALTEPNAGSDLTAIRTTAVLQGDHYVVNGKKLFITNAGLGRTVGLVCTIDGKPSVLVADLPDQEDSSFKINRYGISALAHANNVGLEFTNFKVPKENLLAGKGLMIAYHGLNKGRIALCANAAGVMRSLLANMIPWAKFRITYTKEIGERELVQRRLGELAGLIIGADALATWCSWLLDEGYRGEMECIIAKRFGSESLKEAAVEYFMKTHGGRSFLHGHMFGDNIHDFLAPCIYEGEGEMLSLAFFKGLTKEHGENCFLPIAEKVGELLAKGRIKKFNPTNPIHNLLIWKEGLNYAKWNIGERFTRKHSGDLSWMKGDLKSATEFAISNLQSMPLLISGTMVKHQAGLIDRQCRMAFLSQKVQDLMVIAATAAYASRKEDPIIRTAAEIFCERAIMKLTGKEPSDKYFKKATRLGNEIVKGGFKELADIPVEEIKMQYPR